MPTITAIPASSVHLELARAWAEYNGRKGTPAQLAKIMARMDEPTLARMMSARGVRIVYLETTIARSQAND